MLKNLLLFTAIFGACAASAGNECQIAEQFVVGPISATLNNWPSKEALPQKLPDYRNGAGVREWDLSVVDTYSFEAESIYFGKAMDSDEVAVIGSHIGYSVNSRSDWRTNQRANLYLDIDDDVIALSGKSVADYEGHPSVKLLLKNKYLGYQLSAGKNAQSGSQDEFNCTITNTNWHGREMRISPKESYFLIPMEVWAHFYARGGKATFNSI